MVGSKFTRFATVGLAVSVAVLSGPTAVRAGADPFMGELILSGWSFCPRNFALANGQLLAIAQNQALFSLLGTMYGGNGVTTFALPDLRGRQAIHQGQGPGFTSYTVGQIGGQESFSIGVSQMPTHNHLVQATNSFADLGGPGDKGLASGGNGALLYSTGQANKVMNQAMLTPTGSNAPVPARSPYLTLNWCIAITGIYPSRS